MVSFIAPSGQVVRQIFSGGVHINGQGQAGDFVGHLTYNMTVDAQGNVTLQAGRGVIGCKGATESFPPPPAPQDPYGGA
jgi:hypothetical protein